MVLYMVLKVKGGEVAGTAPFLEKLTKSGSLSQLNFVVPTYFADSYHMGSTAVVCVLTVLDQQGFTPRPVPVLSTSPHSHDR